MTEEKSVQAPDNRTDLIEKMTKLASNLVGDTEMRLVDALRADPVVPPPAVGDLKMALCTARSWLQRNGFEPSEGLARLVVSTWALSVSRSIESHMAKCEAGA